MVYLPQDPEIPPQAGHDVGGTTEVHPIGLLALALVVAIAVFAPRRYAGLPLILLLCFVPAAQRVVIASVDFTFLRILLAAFWARLVFRSEVRPLVWSHLDRLMIIWAVVAVLTGTLAQATLGVFLNRAGSAADALMTYFLFRQLIRTHDDLIRLAMQFVVCSFGVALAFVFENLTQQNPFHIFGGVPRFTEIRGDRLRCQGAFAHSILAGCFWASLIPFYFVRGWLGRGWLLPGMGVAAALLIVVLSASSTPVMSVVFGLLAGAAFLIRGALRWWRWLILAWLAVLHFLLMDMPVWHLLARVNVVGGSTGWHRYHLIDAFITNFQEWWRLGTPSTGHWGYGLQDVTNHYVAEGVAGGIGRLALFVAVIVVAFAAVSRSMRAQGQPPAYRYVTWALGTALFMHCVNFIGVSYFEQIVVEWHMTLAAIGGLTLVPGASVSRLLQTTSGEAVETRPG